MRQEISDRITELMMEYQGKLNASTLLVQEVCTEEEFQAYRRAVGRATDFMFIEISRVLEGRPSMEMSPVGTMGPIGGMSAMGGMGDMSGMSDISDISDMSEANEATEPRRRVEQELSPH